MNKEKQTIIKLEDIAKALRVSISTVSRSLSNSSRVKEATRKKVREKADELGYIPNQIAKSLISGKTGVIGVIIPRYDEAFFIEVCRGIDHYARKHNYRILISSSRNSSRFEKENIMVFEKGIVDGLIISLTHQTKSQTHLQSMANRGTPLVVFDNMNEKIEGAMHVRIDDYSAAYEAVQFLAQKKTVQTVGFIGGTILKSIFNKRYEGYKDSLLSSDFSLKEEFVFNCKSMHQVHEYHEIYNFLSKLNQFPNAFFCSTDSYALLCIKALSKLGKRVPEDIQVVGFGNLHYSRLFNTELTSVSQPSFKMGEKAAELLLSKIIKGAYLPSEKIDELILTTKLIIRNTTC